MPFIPSADSDGQPFLDTSGWYRLSTEIRSCSSRYIAHSARPSCEEPDHGAPDLWMAADIPAFPGVADKDPPFPSN